MSHQLTGCGNAVTSCSHLYFPYTSVLERKGSCKEEPAKGACYIRWSWSGLASERVETELKASDGLNDLAWSGGT